MLVYKDFFDGINDYNYFLSISVNGKKIPITSVVNFSADIKYSIVYYGFSVVLKEIPLKRSFKITFNDETIYTSFGEVINIIDDKSYYQNIKISPYSYYGREVSFDYVK